MADDFSLTTSDLKHYPHFDAPIPLREIELLVTDEKRVISNKFFPFFMYHEEWQPYRSKNGIKPEKKSRPIRYGARRDAYIFAHYRRKLSVLYEARLADMGIAECPIAYRQILKPGTNSGKCNIDFAKDAFDEVDRIGDCVAVALDIKGYFENLSHSRIKKIWCDLLNVDELPLDHYAVFKNITKYRFVEQQSVYERLGYIELIKRGKDIIERFTVPYRKMPKQLCSPEDFRSKICGGNPALPSLIKKNELSHGVPQGAPISDLIANFYLIDFDAKLEQFARVRGGRYMRYSDDILLIIPGDKIEAIAATKFVTNEIQKYGKTLQIKDAKTCVVRFTRSGMDLAYEHLIGPHGKNGLEYLGFRYDGKKIYVRESTISRFYSKVASTAKREGTKHVLANPTDSPATLISSFNYSRLNQKFSRVKKEDLTNDYKSWTFYSYLKRAAHTFGPKGDHIPPQARKFKEQMKARVSKAIERAHSRQKPQA